MVAWEAYKATPDYANSKHWAMTIQPMMFTGDPESKRYGLMPIEQREQHVEGSLWAAFLQGWQAGKASLTPARPENG